MEKEAYAQQDVMFIGWIGIKWKWHEAFRTCVFGNANELIEMNPLLTISNTR